MALTQTNGFAKVNLDSVTGLGEFDVVSEKRIIDAENTVPRQYSNPPRTSQLERRTRLMHVKSGDHDLL